MITKVLLSPVFKFPIPWFDKYVENFNMLGPSWRHIIFTDMPFKAHGNVELVEMDIAMFAGLVQRKTGVLPYVTAPSPKFGDMRPAFGLIFEDYIQGDDFWGHTDLDTVLGNLDKFLTDDFLRQCDLYSNEPGIVNGVFALYRNVGEINWLFAKHNGWPELFQDVKYHAFDEAEFSALARSEKQAGRLRFISNDWHEHDRAGVPHLERRGLGLYNVDTGKEIMMFHFRRTKEWPL